MTDDLAAWLLELIAEDEREARDALERTTTSRRMIRGQMTQVKTEPPRWRTAAWPPGRVLAECDAKRRIIEDCTRYDDEPEVTDGLAPRVLRLLTLPYVDRSGYREEWRP